MRPDTHSRFTVRYQHLVVLALFTLLIGGCPEDPTSNTPSSDADAHPDIEPDIELDLEPDIEPDDDVAPIPMEIDNVVVVENPANALSYFVEWRTSRPSPTTLDVDCEESYQHTFESTDLSTRHSVFVMGLLDGDSCELTIEASAPNEIDTTTASIESVGPLPDFLPPPTVPVLDAERTQEGWTLWSPSDMRAVSPYLLAINDQQGRYRWYTRNGDTAFPGAGNDARVVAEGILAGAGYSQRPGAFVVSWEGRVLWTAPFRSHHDVQVSPFLDDSMLYLGLSRSGCPANTREGTVNEFDRESQEVIWTWRICDHYTPPNAEEKWSHMNAIEPVPGERSVIISVRNQNSLMRVNRDSNEIEWILGENGDFAMSDEAHFLQQHAPQLLPNGNIVLFDNGLDSVREHSRAIELALSFDEDGDPLSAEVVWEHADTTLYSRVRGDVDRLPNGNTLITYSNSEATLEVVLREVTEEGDIVWEMRSPPRFSTYRAERLVEPPLGFVRTID